MHIHIHKHPESPALAKSVAELADQVRALASAISALAASVAKVPSPELVAVVEQVKAGAQLNDSLIPDAAPQSAR